MFGFSASELFLVGFIFFLVLAAPRIGRVGELLAQGTSGRRDAGKSPLPGTRANVTVRVVETPTEKR